MIQSDPTRSLDLTNDWTPVQVEFDVPRDVVQAWAWLMITVPATGTAWFDDASVEVLGPSSAARVPPGPTATRKPAAPAAKKGPAR
jgi:hypothetical protein